MPSFGFFWGTTEFIPRGLRCFCRNRSSADRFAGTVWVNPDELPDWGEEEREPCEVTTGRRASGTACVVSTPSIVIFDRLPRVGQFQLNRSDAADMLSKRGSAGFNSESRLWTTF